MDIPFQDIKVLDLDGRIDERGIRYIGNATKSPDGKWQVLAEVGGALCLVEVNITAKVV